jgi:hypothetical protein
MESDLIVGQWLKQVSRRSPQVYIYSPICPRGLKKGQRSLQKGILCFHFLPYFFQIAVGSFKKMCCICAINVQGFLYTWFKAEHKQENKHKQCAEEKRECSH